MHTDVSEGTKSQSKYFNEQDGAAKEEAKPAELKIWSGHSEEDRHKADQDYLQAQKS